MSVHIVPRITYLYVFGALVILTALTVAAANVNFDQVTGIGALNAIIALTIAIIKAMLVLLFFMHVRYSSRLTWVVVVSGFFWLAILFLFTFSDYLTRHSAPVLAR